MATIGYGDITPSTVEGKIFILICFIIGFTVIPIQLSKLIDVATSEKAVFRAKNSSLKNHVIISGYFQMENALDFLKEFYHSMHGKNNRKALSKYELIRF